MKPWRTVDSQATPDGLLALKQRGERDFLLTLDGRVLMTSAARRSELALGTLACRRLSGAAAPRVLVGGLGMGFTLRAALDVLPKSAAVTVAEINPITAAWCRGPLAPLTEGAVSDPRVQLEFVDVSKLIARVAKDPSQPRFDAVLIDLYVGPDAGTQPGDPLYGVRAISQAAQSLSRGGIYSIWGEARDAAYVRRLEDAGFEVRCERPGKGGLLHVVYVATKG